ncbi:hypothetical protein Tco_0185560 [Tanacetum coccineum]
MMQGYDALNIDFDEELYPHMLTAIASRRWFIGHGLRLAIMKCAESTELREALALIDPQASALHFQVKDSPSTQGRIQEIPWSTVQGDSAGGSYRAKQKPWLPRTAPTICSSSLAIPTVGMVLRDTDRGF